MIWVLAALILWAVGGLLFALALAEVNGYPEETWRVVVLLLACGPICWVILALCLVFIVGNPEESEGD